MRMAFSNEGRAAMGPKCETLVWGGVQHGRDVL